MGDLARSQSEGGLPRDEGDRDKGDYSESNYDDFSGYGGAVRETFNENLPTTKSSVFISCSLVPTRHSLTPLVLRPLTNPQLFGGDAPYEDDDREADKIYQAIDDRMDARRKRRCVFVSYVTHRRTHLYLAPGLPTFSHRPNLFFIPND